jgi:hypothetical protein
MPSELKTAYLAVRSRASDSVVGARRRRIGIAIGAGHGRYLDEEYKMVQVG